MPNPLGSSHPEATLKAAIEHGAPEDAILQVSGGCEVWEAVGERSCLERRFEEVGGEVMGWVE